MSVQHLTKTLRNSGLVALLAPGIITATVAHAAQPTIPGAPAQPDTSHWRCGLCPYREGWYGTLNFGPGFVSDGSFAYGDFRGLDERGVFAAIDGDMHYRNAADRYFDLFAYRAGLDSRALDMRGGQRGHHQWWFAYRDIPKYRGFGSATAYSSEGSERLSLPSDWQKSFTTAGMTALERSLLPVSLKTLRRTLRGGFSMRFPGRWAYDVEFQHETKKGNRPFGAGLFTINTSQFPVPVEFVTDRLEAGLQYSGQQTQIRLGFSGSWFDNGATSITWENPFSSAPENQLLRAALEPDNRFYQFSLQGAFSPRPGWRFSGRAALGRMRQDDPLLPYTINPGFSDLVLPRGNADSRIDTGTLNLAGKLTARLARGLEFYASAKLDQRDNDSPVDGYSIVITDFIPGGERFNRPYSFERDKLDIELRYRAAGALSLSAGFRQENFERTLQSVLETEERGYWGEVKFSGWPAAQLRVKLESSQRDASPYRQVDETGLIENPLMRKFHYADRDRSRAVMELDLVPDRPWSLNLSWSRSEDEYTESTVGLRNSKEENLGADFGVSLTAQISFSAYVSREQISSALSGLDAATESQWDGFTNDRVTTVGLGVSGSLGKRVTLDLDWAKSTSRGRIAVSGSEPFPVLRSRFGNLRGSLSFAVNQSWAIRLSAEYENLSTRDWQIDGLGPGSIPNVLTLGGVSPRYHITAVQLQASYRK